MKDTYFMAIPRTSGTQVIVEVATRLQMEGLQPLMQFDQFAALDPEERESFKFYGGHFYDIFSLYVPKEVQTFTLLREPIARTFSHFKYLSITNQIEHDSFFEFLSDPEWKEIMTNFQTRSFLINRDPRIIGGRIEIEPDPENMVLVEIITRSRLMMEDLPEQLLFDQALNLANSFFLVGITEEHQKTMEILFKLLGLTLPIPEVEHRNEISDSHNPLWLKDYDKAFQIALEITLVDAEFYQFFLKRLSKIDIDKVEKQEELSDVEVV